MREAARGRARRTWRLAALAGACLLAGTVRAAGEVCDGLADGAATLDAETDALAARLMNLRALEQSLVHVLPRTVEVQPAEANAAPCESRACCIALAERRYASLSAIVAQRIAAAPAHRSVDYRDETEIYAITGESSDTLLGMRVACLHLEQSDTLALVDFTHTLPDSGQTLAFARVPAFKGADGTWQFMFVDAWSNVGRGMLSVTPEATKLSLRVERPAAAVEAANVRRQYGDIVGMSPGACRGPYE